MRMLDNVIDINYYSVPTGARTPTSATARWAWASWASRMRCTMQHIPYGSATRRSSSPTQSMEAVSYYAY